MKYSLTLPPPHHSSQMDTPKQLQTREDNNNGCTSPSLEFSFTTSLHPSHITPPFSPLRTTRPCPNDSSSRNSISTLDIFLDEQLIIPVQIDSNTSMSSHNSNTSREKGFLSVERIESDLGQRYSIRSNTSSKSQENCSKPKLKSFSSIFRLGSRENKTEETEKKEESNKTRKNKKRLDLGQVWKKYINMVENFFYNKAERERRDLRRRPHSFSGNTNLREMEKWRKRKLGQRSAPASMRTSPANSGHFTGSSVNKLSSSSDESTMEELQNAIQAAIAHCKSSIAAKAEPV